MSPASKEDEEKIQMQLGCMNKIFQLFEPRYKRLPQGQSVSGNKFNNASDKLKDQALNNNIQEKHKESVESSRNVFSSSCSSLDYSLQVQTKPSTFCKSIVSDPSSPNSIKKDDLWVSSVDIRDVVKDSTIRMPRAVSVKTVAKDKQKGPKMTHVDSPRHLQHHPKHATYERRDQNLVKLKETCNDVKQPSRFSYDDLESLYKLKSIAIVTDCPRLSLDSKQSSIKHNAIVINPSQIRELVCNKRPSSSLVARLMGLDLNCEALKIQPCLDDEKIPFSRLSRESVSPTVSNSLIRIPLEPAPWKQEVKQSAKKKVKEQACKSAYDQIDKRVTEIEFKTSVKDLIDLKHTLKLSNPTSNSMVNTSIPKDRKVNPGRIHRRNLTSTETKTTARTKKQVSPSHKTDCLAGPSVRHQRTKIVKQSNGHQIALHNEQEVRSKVWTRENKNKFAESLMGYKPMAEQPSPISILDTFYTKDTSSPIKKKTYAFKDDDDPCFDEQESIRVRTDDLISSTKLYELTSRSHDIKFENSKQIVHQIEVSNSTSDVATINLHEGMNEDHISLNQILSASGFLKNFDCSSPIVHLHSTSSLIDPELFYILEQNKEWNSRINKSKRKMTFDTVNNTLIQLLARLACRWRSTSRRTIDGGKLLEELWFEINNLHIKKTSDLHELINIITEDVHADYYHEVPNLVFNIEQLVFNDLITEIVNVATSFPQ
ncbi:hypothetical protein R6Q59_005633 [Mikania micrantha]|uniref:DUF4378 domain-containing protein n=1 Tax=Mikania micrantha TaxID=192012 RepID=A0A5N6Q3S9_9ASTR|nr:hypothetical protein E3N88_01757 [Mikania micrantha]